jgi:hypothetical protein
MEMDIRTVREKVATAECDVICAGGLTIMKGQRVAVAIQYCNDWKSGGFRTIVGANLDFTNHEAFYEAFSSGC